MLFHFCILETSRSVGDWLERKEEGLHYLGPIERQGLSILITQVGKTSRACSIHAVLRESLNDLLFDIKMSSVAPIGADIQRFDPRGYEYLSQTS